MTRMEIYLSVGVTTIVAQMAAHRLGRDPITLEALDVEEMDRLEFIAFEHTALPVVPAETCAPGATATQVEGSPHTRD
jgi:hypothetical protein